MPLLHRSLLAASLLVLSTANVRAQEAAPPRDKHDSITVTKLTFEGANDVSSDDLKRLIFTRSTTCRLPFLIPICKLTPAQLVNDRRRTTSAALASDIDKLLVYYWQRGFREAQVDTIITPTGRGHAVVFNIVEGPATKISSVDITQQTPVLSARELADLVTLRAGDPMNLVALDTTLARLRAAVWNRGYGDVRIDTTVPRPDAARMIPVRIAIEPGWVTRVGAVKFEGNAYLSDATLQRAVLLEAGELYTRDAVLESQKRLYQSPAIARALAITPPAGDSIKTVTVAITEMPQRQASITAGFNTIEYGQAAADVRLNNLGSGRWLSLRAAAGNLLGEQLNGRAIFQQALPDDVSDTQGYLRPTYQASVTLTQPWIRGPRTSAAVTAFAGRRSIPNVVIDEDIGVTVGVVHEFSTRTPLGLNYRFETTRVLGSAVYYCAGFGICDATTRESLTQRQRLAPISVSAWMDRSDDLEVPTRGFTAVVDAEHASSATASNFTHSRIAMDGSMYRVVGKRKIVAGEEIAPKVLALHARAGYVRAGGSGAMADVLHPRARFYAGGMQSVRGFAENELGPQVLQARAASLLAAGCTNGTIVTGGCDPSGVPSDQLFPRPIGGSSLLEASAEFRIPLLKALGGVVFLDGAYVGAGGLITATKGRTAITPGGGFRYRSPLGVLRMDFGLRPVGARSLPVVVAVVDAQGNERIVTLAPEKRYSPVDDSPSWRHSIARRIVVHFAMGQAF